MSAVGLTMDPDVQILGERRAQWLCTGPHESARRARIRCGPGARPAQGLPEPAAPAALSGARRRPGRGLRTPTWSLPCSDPCR